MPSNVDTKLNNLTINEVNSDSTLEEMVNNNQIEANQFYSTPDELDGFMSLPIGSIFSSALPLTNAGFHLLDGSTIASEGIYSQFVNLLETLNNTGYSTSLSTIDEYAIDLDAYGQSGRFVINNSNSNIYNTSVSYNSKVIIYSGYRLNSSSGLTSYSSSFVIFIPARYGQKFNFFRNNAPLYNYIYETTNYGTSFTSLGMTNPTFVVNEQYTVTNKNTKYVAITISNTDASTYNITNANTTISMSPKTVKLPKITEFISSNNGGKIFGITELDSIMSHRHIAFITENGTQYGKLNYGSATSSTSANNQKILGADIYSGWIDSNPTIYSGYEGDSETKPKNTRYPYYIVLANSYKTQIQVDIDNIVHDLNLKANISGDNNNFQKTDLIYDMSSQSASINWGYTGGLPANDVRIDGHDFNKYSKLICFVSNESAINQYNSYIIVEVDLKHQAEPTSHNRFYCGSNSAVTNYVVYMETTFFEEKGALIGVNEQKTGITIYGFSKTTSSATKLSGLYCTQIIGVY